MSNISGKINLRQLKSKQVEKDGKKYLVIGIDSNNLFVGEKGVYLDLQGYEIKDKKTDSKDTHLVKQSLPKEVFDKMSEDEKRAMPILGNFIDWGNSGGHGEPEPQVDEDMPDDIPF